MSFVTICDLCKQPIQDISIRLNFSGKGVYDMMDLCEKCWEDKKNWIRLHKIPKK